MSTRANASQRLGARERDNPAKLPSNNSPSSPGDREKELRVHVHQSAAARASLPSMPEFSMSCLPSMPESSMSCPLATLTPQPRHHRPQTPPRPPWRRQRQRRLAPQQGRPLGPLPPPPRSLGPPKAGHPAAAQPAHNEPQGHADEEAAHNLLACRSAADELDDAVAQVDVARQRNHGRRRRRRLEVGYY